MHSHGGRPEKVRRHRTSLTSRESADESQVKDGSHVKGDQGAFRNEAWVSEISFREPFDESRLVMPEDVRIEPFAVE